MNSNCFALIAVCLVSIGSRRCFSQPVTAVPATRTKAEYHRAALLRDGDAARGCTLFLDETRLACGKCHSTDGQGGKVGPDLSAVGDKFGRREIIDSILSPSAVVADGYGAITMTMKGGDEHLGIVKQVTAMWTELMGADGRLVRLNNADIAERRPAMLSLMPDGLANVLTLEEFIDVIDYLVSLKQKVSAEMTRRGMPSEIVSLTRPVRFEPIHSGDLKFDHPVWFGPVPGAAGAFAVVEHETGRIWRLEDTSGGMMRTLWASLGAVDKGARGLIGLVFHPDFARNSKFYTATGKAVDGKFATIIDEHRSGPDSATPARTILNLDAATGVHYGGSLQFGPDGFLYIGMGDTGPQEDPQGNAQNLSLLRGKIMRIDVDHPSAGRAYGIPQDNPFLGQDGVRPEIWAYGLREPWRFSFDTATGDLWVGDVGQDRYEEVTIVRRGENHGWNIYEGFERFSNRYQREGANYVPPVFAYARKYGPSVTGGFVYRGRKAPGWDGVYIFGDYESRRIFGLTQDNRMLKVVRQIGTVPQRIVSFGRDGEGELYVVGYEGTIYRLDLTGPVFE